ncbi:MAG TPA: RNA-binding cell elongation regulator Jag/EloR [Ktedonobacterales bacterium]|nr:RNA-binding cell elongation regulator Jag/EloR [Ktedonobacterales bacterium]
MDSVEASGKTVDDAVLQALARLGKRRDEVNIEVLQEPSRGSFGLGIRDARVRVTVKQRRASSGAVITPELADALLGFGESAPSPAAPGRTQPPPKQSVPRQPVVPPPDEDEEDEEDYEEDEDEEYLEEDEEEDEEYIEEDEEEDEEDEALPGVRSSAVASALEAVEEEEELPEGEPGPASREVAAASVEVLQTILFHMGIRGQVEVRSRDPLTLNVRMDDGLGLLIGRRGETLASLQLLVNLIVSHQIKHRQRIIVDVEDYRLRREENLRQLALRIAQQVRQSRRAIPLEAMPANERRIVHMTLSDSKDVMTHSEGEGDQRRVIISLRRPTGR